MTSANTRPRIRYLITGRNPVHSPGSVSGNADIILSYRKTIGSRDHRTGVWSIDTSPDSRTTQHHVNCLRDVLADLGETFVEKEGV